MLKDTNIRDLKMMFDGTIIRYKGLPVYVFQILEQGANDFTCEFRYLNDSKRQRKPFLLDEFDIKPVRLGYVNTPHGCFFLMRSSARLFKQGLSPENVMVWRNDGVGLTDMGHFAFDKVNHLSEDRIWNTIQGIYPSLRDAYNLLDDEVHCVAFDRQFSISEMLIIHYRGSKVGVYDKEKNRIKFNEGFENLERAVDARAYR